MLEEDPVIYHLLLSLLSILRKKTRQIKQGVLSGCGC